MLAKFYQRVKKNTMELMNIAAQVREKAYAPYSKFKVGAAVQTEDGSIFGGCNVENVAYPEGTCAEAGAIAAMVAAGHRKITAVAVIADCPTPVTPCGGCRQKIAEFADPDAGVTMATVDGAQMELRVRDLLPGVFTPDHMSKV